MHPLVTAYCRPIGSRRDHRLAHRMCRGCHCGRSYVAYAGASAADSQASSSSASPGDPSAAPSPASTASEWLAQYVCASQVLARRFFRLRVSATRLPRFRRILLAFALTTSTVASLGAPAALSVLVASRMGLRPGSAASIDAVISAMLSALPVRWRISVCAVIHL